MKRTVVPLSLSLANPDAQIVSEALEQVPHGRRSAAILRWAAAYLSGQTNTQPAEAPALGITDDELDSLLDDF